MSVNKTVSIAVLSGKGGVGKSNLALNLGYALHKAGARVLLMDCDLGLANLDVLLGLTPDKHMQSLVDSDLDPAQVVVEVEPGGLDLLPASSGVADVAEQERRIPPFLVQKLNEFVRDYDFVIMDIGAGIGPTGMAFAAMAQIRLLIITPEPTSLTDGYALIKVLASRYGVRDHFVLVNQIENKREETQTFKSLSSATAHFLDITPTSLGAIRSDRKVLEAVRKQKALFKLFPASPAAQDCAAIAAKLLQLRTTMLPRIVDVAPMRALNVNPLDSEE